MPILDPDLILRPSSARSWTNPAVNGGRMAATTLACGEVGAVWPAVTSAHRAAGQSLTTKLFWHNVNVTDTALDPYVFLAAQPASGDYIYVRPATQDDMESQIASTARRYTAAALSANISVGATTVNATLPDATLANCFQVGDHVKIYSGGTPGQSGTTQELALIAGVSATGTALTVTLAAGTINSYRASGAYICSLIWPGGTLSPNYAVVGQSGSGRYDFETNPLTLTAGTIRQRWTLSYTNATTVEVSGDDLGSLGTYPTSAAIAPVNPAGGTYFSLAAGGHGAAHAAGDTITLDTYAAAIACWATRVTPAGTVKSVETGWSYISVGCESG